MDNKKRPIQRFQAGNIQVAVWSNKGTKGTWFNVSTSRGYKDEHGQRKSVNSFGLQDIPLLRKLLEQAYDYVYSLPRLPEAGDEAMETTEVASGYGAAPESWNEVPAETA